MQIDQELRGEGPMQKNKQIAKSVAFSDPWLSLYVGMSQSWLSVHQAFHAFLGTGFQLALNQHNWYDPQLDIKFRVHNVSQLLPLFRKINALCTRVAKLAYALDLG
jgi:hypothetical protein